MTSLAFLHLTILGLAYAYAKLSDGYSILNEQVCLALSVWYYILK